MHVILAVGAGHPVVHLDEERRFTDQCRHVIGVGAQREVAYHSSRLPRGTPRRALSQLAWVHSKAVERVLGPLSRAGGPGDARPPQALWGV
jgi:hypothetical protein